MLSAAEQRLFDHLVLIAESGQRCPSSPELSAALAIAAGRGLQSLARMGHVRIEISAHNYRTVELRLPDGRTLRTKPPPGMHLPYLVVDRGGSYRPKRLADAQQRAAPSEPVTPVPEDIADAPKTAVPARRRSPPPMPRSPEQLVAMAERQTSPFWRENDAKLRELAAGGASTQEAADALGVNKNQVIGRATRLGLEWARSKGHRELPVAKPELEFPRAGDCLWPHGDPGEDGFHFCGDRCRDVGEPYCARHMAQAHVQAGQRRAYEAALDRAAAYGGKPVA